MEEGSSTALRGKSVTGGASPGGMAYGSPGSEEEARHGCARKDGEWFCSNFSPEKGGF